jgi:iron(II)-dependent oxidoreductase
MNARGIDRNALSQRYRLNRERSAALFRLVDDAAYYTRPIPLRHPFAFYEGHIPAFSFITLNERALGEPAIDAHLQKVFERGIDPRDVTEAQRHGRGDWPERTQIARFGRACDERVSAAIAAARLEDPSVPRLVRAQSAFNILEHEAMHHETLTYIIHQLPCERKGRIAQSHDDTAPPRNAYVSIPAGSATLGVSQRAVEFGWDNEFDEHRVHVDAFSIQRYPVTNAAYLRFVNEGGPRPPFWAERDGTLLLRGVFEYLPLPLSWPVYVTQEQAAAYAAWAGGRLPTEAEYHRAAYGTPAGDERAFPWGEEPPTPLRGNFDFQRFDPEPVDAHPLGASAWGIHDLVGNGWEWTASLFEPFPGFAPMPSYPQYSADFFDGRHYVLKGASPVTARELLRPGFRNWFYGDYPYVYAKFRCAANGTSER